MFWTCAEEDHSHPSSPGDTTPPTITNHNFAVAENISIGSAVGTVVANDNMEIAYYTIANNTAFSISTNGIISSLISLDYDSLSSYNLLVQVSDRAGNNTLATITINITDVDAAPTVITRENTGVQNNTITLNGNLSDLGTNSDGNPQVNEYGFVYSTSASQSNDLQVGKIGVYRVGRTKLTNTGNYSFAIANILPCTDYYYRAFAVNSGGTSYGEVSNFSSYHQSFALNGADDGERANLVCANATHTYNVPLSHELVYSLNVDASSNVSDNVTIYEGSNTEPLYIRAGPFTDIDQTNVTFPGAINGSRYMILPLASNSHRLVISNNSSQNQNYSLNLEEYTGTTPATGRLLLAPQKMGYYDSANDIRHFWVHIPPNKDIQVEVDTIRANGFTDIVLLNESAAFSQAFNDTQKLETSENFSQYAVLLMGTPASNAQTNIRFIFSFTNN